MVHLSTRWKVVRPIAFGLLVLALSGPWYYDEINVPAEFVCQKPNIRLYGDFCGLPITGLGILAGLGSEVIALAERIPSGAAEGGHVAGLLLYAASVILVMLAPIASFMWRSTERGRYSFWLQVTIFAIAILVAATMLTQQVLSPIQLWGVWLYAALLLLVLVEETAAMLAKKRNQPAA
jgi:CDP-diglyceride synthetase